MHTHTYTHTHTNIFVLIKIHKNKYCIITLYYTTHYIKHMMDDSIYPERPSQLLRALLHSIYVFVYFLWNRAKRVIHTILDIGSPPLPTSVEIPPAVKSKEEIYIENEKNRFLKIMQGGEDLYKSFNTNTDAEFYDVDLYKKTMLTENNSIESKWNKNILYESTPRGNLILFYDAYKKGFSYYSDNRSLSYAILNAAAMKYTRVFSCMDLFMDDSIFPERPSQLLSIYEKEEKKEAEKKKSDIPIDKELLKKAPFAKLKKYNQSQTQTQSQPLSQPPSQINSAINLSNMPGVIPASNTSSSVSGSSLPASSNTKQIVNKNINKFMYLGKINNFSIIQKIPKKKVIVKKISTSYDALFQSNHELQNMCIQKDTFSYKDFKSFKAKCKE
jgi:hypothetical protein